MSLVPDFKYPVPSLSQQKLARYIDFPIVFNKTVTNEAFYVDRDFTFVSSDPANTTLYKWEGNGWVALGGIANPEEITIRGFFSVTTAANAYVTITEHTQAGDT